MVDQQDELLTVQDVATRLKLTPLTIYRYIDTNQLLAIKLAGAVRVRASDLEAFLTAHNTVTPEG